VISGSTVKYGKTAGAAVTISLVGENMLSLPSEFTTVSFARMKKLMSVSFG
jgi:hypothetical protein